MKLPDSIKVRPVKTDELEADPITEGGTLTGFMVGGRSYTTDQFVAHFRPRDARAKVVCEMLGLEFPTRGKEAE